MGIQITRERYDDCIDEMLPFLVKHYKEIAWNQDKIKLDIDHEAYRKIESLGWLHLHIARDDGRMVGYASWIVQPTNMHYRTLTLVRNDVIFVDKTKRGSVIGKMLLKFAEKEFKELNLNMMMLHIKKSLDWGPLAAHCGYEHVESSWWKWIGD